MSTWPNDFGPWFCDVLVAPGCGFHGIGVDRRTVRPWLGAAMGYPPTLAVLWEIYGIYGIFQKNINKYNYNICCQIYGMLWKFYGFSYWNFSNPQKDAEQ